MRILLDAGHGIDTLGKRSPDGAFLEYKWNREVAELAYALLEEHGFDVDFVVTETNDIPLKTRVRRVNEVCNLHGSQNVLLLSIHSNAAGMGATWMNAKGWSCYTTKGMTKSDKVASCLYDAFEEEFKDRTIRRDLSDGDPDWEEDFYIIKKTSMRSSRLYLPISLAAVMPTLLFRIRKTFLNRALKSTFSLPERWLRIFRFFRVVNRHLPQLPFTLQYSR